MIGLPDLVSSRKPLFWQYFGAAPDHLVLALCFAAFALGNATDLSIRSYLSDRKRRMKTDEVRPDLRRTSPSAIANSPFRSRRQLHFWSLTIEART